MRLDVLSGAFPVELQLRRLTLATIINMTGTGLYMSAGTIFLVRSAGLTPSEVGLGLSVGATVGFGFGPAIGDAADRRGGRELLLASMILQALASAALLLVHDVATLAISAAGSAIGSAGSRNARAALIGVLTDQHNGARVRTYLRAVTNVGLAVGTIGAAIILAINTRPAYVAMIFSDTGTFVIAALVILRLPRTPPPRLSEDRAATGPRRKRWVALSDTRYLAVTALVSIASIQYSVLVYALPLWISLHTSAPRSFAAVVFFVCCVLVAAIQVPATRSIKDSKSAARLLALSGPLFLFAWIAIAAASGPERVPAILLLIVGVMLHSLAEVWQAAGAFELSFVLSRTEALGQYQGVFGFGHDLVDAIAPFLVIALCVTWGKPGWIVLAGVVALSSIGVTLATQIAGPHSAASGHT